MIYTKGNFKTLSFHRLLNLQLKIYFIIKSLLFYQNLVGRQLSDLFVQLELKIEYQLKRESLGKL